MRERKEAVERWRGEEVKIYVCEQKNKMH